MALTLTSNAVPARGEIPARYTCDGPNLSPPLTWTGAPSGTRSFVLIMHDPDAPDPKHPRRDWVHWLVYNLPADCASLPEGAALPQGTRSGRNDFNQTGYGGPCPPVGRHRYFLKLHALDTLLPDLGTPGRAQLEQAMQGHVLAETELMAFYQH